MLVNSHNAHKKALWEVVVIGVSGRGQSTGCFNYFLIKEWKERGTEGSIRREKH